MILGDATAVAGGGATLDDVFRDTVARRPDAIALADPPNREHFTEGTPRRLSYAECDRIASAVAGRLRRLGLGADAVVAVQLANTVEAALTFLGVLRAGMIAAPVPLLWRRADLIAALGQVGAKAIITACRIGDAAHDALATQVAAELFSVRHICSFGSKPQDGVIAFDDLLSEQPDGHVSVIEREHPAAHVAVVTFDVTQQGVVAIARNHKELLTGGAAVLLEARLPPQSTILACCAMNSFAGLAVTLLPWLLTGGTLALHQPFDAEVFANQCSREHGVAVALPGGLVPRLADAGLLQAAQIKTVLAAWRTPERLVVSPPWASADTNFVDVVSFGEIAVFGSRRGLDGQPQHLTGGLLDAPRGVPGAITVAELTRTETGTLALRGPMVPQHPFPAGAQPGSNPYRADPQGFVDTGYPCRLDRRSGTLALTGPPPGLVTVGGCRFALRDLEHAVRRADPEAALVALPDALGGHRLAGHAIDPEGVSATLVDQGANALLVNAFRTRRGREAA